MTILRKYTFYSV